jgi:hypothetical protein
LGGGFNVAKVSIIDENILKKEKNRERGRQKKNSKVEVGVPPGSLDLLMRGLASSCH